MSEIESPSMNEIESPRMNEIDSYCDSAGLPARAENHSVGTRGSARPLLPTTGGDSHDDDPNP